MNNTSTGGQFTVDEAKFHINILELKAALLSLQALCKKANNAHILIKMDNTTAVSAINKMESTKSIEIDKESQVI